jgi:hypothetical protein
MKALTLHACWAWAIAHAGKDIENRVWSPPKAMIGQRIAIHAGAKPGDHEGQADCAEMCQLAGAEPPPTWPRSAILCTAILADVVTVHSSDWFGGPYGWVLTDVLTLPQPLPCKGMLGLWEVKSPLILRVLNQLY